MHRDKVSSKHYRRVITSKCGLMISLSVKNVGLLYTYVSGNDEFRKIIKLTTRKAITYPI